jgi:hypothetical protein
LAEALPLEARERQIRDKKRLRINGGIKNMTPRLWTLAIALGLVLSGAMVHADMSSSDTGQSTLLMAAGAGTSGSTGSMGTGAGTTAPRTGTDMGAGSSSGQDFGTSQEETTDQDTGTGTGSGTTGADSGRSQGSTGTTGSGAGRSGSTSGTTGSTGMNR